MKLLPYLKIKVLSKNKIMKNILVNISLISDRKNDYHLGYYLTNDNGEILIKKEDIIKIINETQREYLMDYSGNIDNCSKIKISIKNKDELIKCVERLVEFYPEKAKTLNELINKSSNNFSYEKSFSPPDSSVYAIDIS